MNIKEKLKKSIRSPGFWISAGGLGLLGTAYFLWLRQSNASAAGKALAALSAAMFAAVCLRFIPGWMDFWNPRKMLPAQVKSAEPPYMLRKIFFGFLIYSAAIIFIVYLLRGSMGHGWDFVSYLNFWKCTDSQHYLDIARDWYLSEGDWDRLVQLVFLPGYPIAVRAANLLAGSYLYSGLIVSALCFAGTGCVFYRLMCLDAGHEAALRGLKYLCVIPGAFFFVAPMSESLFMLLCAGCVYLARKEKWLTACLLGALASFTRSLGMALFVPALFEMVSHAVREKGHRRFWRFALLLIIPGGFAAYCLINYQVSGDAFKYMEYQSVHWGQNLGLFFNTAAYQLDNALWRWETDKRMFWGLWLPNLIAAFSALGIMTAAAKKMRPGYNAWFIAYFFIAIGATWLLSAPRYLAALLPMPMAIAVLTEKKEADTLATLVCVFLGFCYLLAFVSRWQVW